MDRNAEFDIVKEVRLEQSKARRNTKIVDEKSVIQEKYIPGYNRNLVRIGKIQMCKKK